MYSVLEKNYARCWSFTLYLLMFKSPLRYKRKTRERTQQVIITVHVGWFWFHSVFSLVVLVAYVPSPLDAKSTNKPCSISHVLHAVSLDDATFLKHSTCMQTVE